MMILDSNTCSLDGMFLIEASAGTGKTYNIQNLAVRLILEKNLTIDQILIVTFTKAATAELCDRIRKILQSSSDFLSMIAFDNGSAVLPDGFERERLLLKNATGGFRQESTKNCLQKLKDALQNFDDNAISTIDSFCQRMLAKNAFESGILFQTELKEGSEFQKLLQKLLRNQWRRYCYDPDNRFTGIYRGLINLDHYFEDSSAVPPDEYLLSAENSFPPRSPKNKISLHDLIERPEIDFDTVPDHGTPEKTAVEILEILSKLSQIHLEMKQYLNPQDLLCSLEIREQTPDKRSIEELENFADKFMDGSQYREFVSRMPTELLESFCFEIAEMKKAFQRLRVMLLRTIRKDAAAELEKLKQRENFQTFKDLQLRMTQALRAPGQFLVKALRDQFKAAIIDEFQDTDQVQYEIFTSIFGSSESGTTSLFLVGDPKQAIYAFRGGDIFTYLSAARRIGWERILSLKKNFRSADSLVESVNSLFLAHSMPFADPEITFTAAESSGKKPLFFGTEEDQNPLHYLDCGSGKDDSFEICAEMIYRLLTEEVFISSAESETEKVRLIPSDIAVLLRSSYDLSNLKTHLQKRGIPFVTSEDNSLFDTQESRDLLKFLRAIQEPANISRVIDFMQTSLIESGQCRNIASSGKDEIKNRIQDVQKNLADVQSAYNEKGFVHAFKLFSESNSLSRRISALPDGSARFSNLIQLRDLITAEEKRGKNSLETLIPWMEKEIYPKTRTLTSENTILSTDVPSVKIMTIHKSKGLQFPVVFLPDLAGFEIKEHRCINYHDPADENAVKVCTPGASHSLLPVAESLQEELRITYVALTRAVRACYITIPKNPEKLTAINWLVQAGKIAENGYLSFASLKEEFQKLPKKSFAEAMGDGVIIEKPECRTSVYTEPEKSELQEPCWTCEILPPPVKLSYSEVHNYFQTGNSKDCVPDEEIPSEIIAERRENNSAGQPLNVFMLPKGDLFGTACHNILEKIDFRTLENLEKMIPRYLSAVNIGEKADIAEKMFKQVVASPIPLDGSGTFLLNGIGWEDRYSEISFDFNDSKGFCSEKIVTLLNSAFAQKLNSLGLEPIRARSQIFRPEASYTGTADLICRVHGKCYIIDWKTDILGGRFPDFLPENLFVPMWEKFYLYQSLLYSAALLRYLVLRTGKSAQQVYHEDYGGIRYLFLRGMSPEAPGRGIFSMKPDFSLIQGIAEVIL